MLVAVLSGLLANNLLFTVFVVALPTVATGLHTSVATITWVVTGPMLTYGVAAPLAGKVSDIRGHRRTYILGMVFSVVVALGSALAPDAGMLVAARALSGVAGAVVGASSMAVVFDAFDPSERVKAMGWWSLVGAGGPVLGIAIGGPLIEYLGWRSLFVLQIPLILAALALALFVLPASLVRTGERVRLFARDVPRRPGRFIGPGAARAEPGASAGEPASDPASDPASARTGLLGRLDLGGAVLVTLAVGGLLLALNRAPELGWGSPAVLLMLAGSVAFAIGFVVVERRAAEPLVPLSYLRERNFTFPIGAQVFANFAYMGGFFLAPLLFEQVFGYGVSAAGLLSIPRPLVFSLVAPGAGYFAQRLGTRGAALAGTLAVVASMGVFMLAGGGGGVFVAEAALVLSGIGLGVATPALSAAVGNVADAASLGIVSATQQLMVQVGVVAGIQVMQTLQAGAARSGSQVAGPGLAGSFHYAFGIGGIVALLGVACAAATR
ncbi:MAG: MFS transporter [Acidimicrobiales bacterium]